MENARFSMNLRYIQGGRDLYFFCPKRCRESIRFPLQLQTSSYNYPEGQFDRRIAISAQVQIFAWKYWESEHSEEDFQIGKFVIRNYAPNNNIAAENCREIPISDFVTDGIAK